MENWSEFELKIEKNLKNLKKICGRDNGIFRCQNTRCPQNCGDLGNLY